MFETSGVEISRNNSLQALLACHILVGMGAGTGKTQRIRTLTATNLFSYQNWVRWCKERNIGLEFLSEYYLNRNTNSNLSIAEAQHIVREVFADAVEAKVFPLPKGLTVEDYKINVVNMQQLPMLDNHEDYDSSVLVTHLPTGAPAVQTIRISLNDTFTTSGILIAKGIHDALEKITAS